LNVVCIGERIFSLVLSRFRCFTCLDFDVESFFTFNFERGMFFFDNFCSNLVLEDDFENSDGCTHDEDNMLVHVGGGCLVTKTNAYNYLMYFNCQVTKKQTNSHSF
jgi:hypothetical protein